MLGPTLAATAGDYSAAQRLQVERKRVEATKDAATLLDLLAPLERREALLDKVEKLAAELAKTREMAARIKREKAREARANAENDLHREMFKVADDVGGLFSTLRNPNGVRFEAKDLVFGRPEQAALGVEHYMCVDDGDLRAKMNDGLAAIRAEVTANGTDVDKECLQYVLNKVAGDSDQAFQGGLKRDCDAQGIVLPSRRGKRLPHFVADPKAQMAKLSEAHVAALRFYTTAAFSTINNGLRDQTRYRAERPHPFPVTVAFIAEGLKRLRTVAGKSAQANTEMTLYRGMKGMKVQDNFLQMGKGGTELAPMSTTSSLKVAMMYSASEDSLLLRVLSKNFMVRGPDISFLSAFPAEQEFYSHR